MLMNKELNYIRHYTWHVLWIAEWSALRKPSSHAIPHHSPDVRSSLNFEKKVLGYEKRAAAWDGVVRNGDPRLSQKVCKEPKHGQMGNDKDTPPQRCLQLRKTVLDIEVPAVAGTNNLLNKVCLSGKTLPSRCWGPTSRPQVGHLQESIIPRLGQEWSSAPGTWLCSKTPESQICCSPRTRFVL